MPYMFADVLQPELFMNILTSGACGLDIRTGPPWDSCCDFSSWNLQKLCLQHSHQSFLLVYVSIF